MVNYYTIGIAATGTLFNPDLFGAQELPRQVSYWVRRYLRSMLTHVENMRRRVAYYGTGSRHRLVRRRDDTRIYYDNKNTKRRRRRIAHADSDTEEYA